MNLQLVAKNLRYYRRLREWSVMDLSKATGLSSDFISRVEDGVMRKVHPYTLEKIANALAISLQELLDDKPPPAPPPPAPPLIGGVADWIGEVLAVGVFLVAAAIISSLLRAFLTQGG